MLVLTLAGAFLHQQIGQGLVLTARPARLVKLVAQPQHQHLGALGDGLGADHGGASHQVRLQAAECDIEDAGDDLVNGFSRYKKRRQSFQGGGYLGDLIRAVIHFINRWGRTKDRLGDLKQKQQELINKSKDLLAPPPPSGGNGHGPAAGTTPPLGDSPPRPIDLSTNGSQPQPQPQDQAKGATGHG